MRTFKHIPAPWSVKWNEKTNRAAIRKESDKRTICTITPNSWDNANADLIAAAPDMLEALQRANSLLNSHFGITNRDEAGNSVHDEIRAAILKAGDTLIP